MKLGVNIDHVATLRNARLKAGQKPYSNVFPDPVRAALLAEKAGAHSIVMHLREDRRHIRDADLFEVKKALRIRLNMEMSLAPDIVKTALRLKPHQATLVPEKRNEQTTEGGLDVAGTFVRVSEVVRNLKKKGIEVSLFIDPDRRQLEAARESGADAVEFHTGDYANAITPAAIQRQFDRLYKAALFAKLKGIVAHAGHGLDYDNVRLMKKIPGLVELNIGYSIVTRSLWTGWDAAVKEMARLIR